MESEILKLLPWASMMAMLGVVGVLARVILNFGKTADAAATAKVKAEKVEGDLSAFKLEVAGKYVQSEALRSMRDEISASMNRLGDRLDRIVELSQRRDERGSPPRT